MDANDPILKLAQYLDVVLTPEQQEHVVPMIREITIQHYRRTQTLLSVRNNLETIRLDMKYLMFDLEATKRERDALARELGR